MRISRLFLLIVFALGAGGALAKTVPVPGWGVSITIPDDWTVLDRPSLALVAAAPGEVSALGITIGSHAEPNGVYNPVFIRELVDAFLKRTKKSGASVRVVDSGAIKINGVPAAYVNVEQTFSGNRTIYSLEYDMAANGNLYVLTFDTRDAFVVPTLEKIAESFRFDKPPQLPAPVDFLTERLKEVIGTLVLLALLIVLALWVRRMIYARMN